jgi:predicted kinase
MNNIFLMVGLPGSGKSYFVESHFKPLRDVVVSSDEIRAELSSLSLSRKKENKAVFSEMRDRTLKYLAEGYDVWYDATNLTIKDRSGILQDLPNEVYVRVYLMATPYAVCELQNNLRTDPVPEKVLQQYRMRFEMPLAEEGIDQVTIIEHNLSRSLEELKLEVENAKLDDHYSLCTANLYYML